MRKTIRTAAVILGLGAFSAASADDYTKGLEAFNKMSSWEAREFVDKARRTGDPLLLDYAGWVHQKGLGVPEDALAAGKFYVRAADKGNNRAWNHLRDLADRKGFVEAVGKDAEKGDPESRNLLGELYRHGWGVKVDHPGALGHFKAAADKGYAPAVRNVGLSFQMGWGVKRDLAEAAKWYREAEGRDPAAREALGKFHQEGWGVKKDMGKALSLYLSAAQELHADAQNDLGWAHQHGLGVEKSDEKALSWYRKAALNGNANAANNLAYMYRNGRGTEKDEVKAAEYYLQSANAGNQDAVQGVDAMTLDGLDPKEILRKLRDAVHFATNSADLSEETAGLLRSLGEALARTRAKVELFGHCDSRGSEGYNQALSEKRAEAVREYLLYHGANRQRVSAKGFGESKPVASNDSEADRAKNRRVEIKIHGL